MLSQELRPNRWEDVAGQKENINILKAIVRDPENSPKCLIFQGAFGSGKCVKGDTRVETSIGYVRIKNLIENPVFDDEGFMDISDRNIRVLDNRLATHFYYGGVEDTVRISSTSFELEGTKEHKIKCLTDTGVEWVQLQDLKVGDYVCVTSNEEKKFIFNNPVKLAPRITFRNDFYSGYLCGFILQMGNLDDERESIEFVGSEVDLDYVARLFEKDFFDSEDVDVSLGSRRKNNKPLKRKKKTNIKMSISDKSLYYWAKGLNIAGSYIDREVPDEVFRTNQYFLSGILSSMFDLGVSVEDTSIVYLKFIHKNVNILNLFTDITRLFGVVCGLINNSKGSYTVVRDRKSISDFADLVNPFNGYLITKLFDLIDSLKDKGSQHLIPKTAFVEKEFNNLIDTIKKDFENLKCSGWGAFTKDTIISTIQRNRGDFYRETSWEALKDLLSDKDLYHSDFDYCMEHYRFIPIKEITYGREEVYDLTVEGTHCFLANGLLNHNTTSARILARELNKIKDIDFDIVNSKYYYEFDSTVIGNVDAIRSLREEFTVSYGDYWRVVVLDEAHAVSSAAQNALLKMLEETTGKTIYIMATTEVNKLLPTIRSRSLELQFNPVPEDEIIKNITKVCEDRNIQVSDEVKRLIADRSYGHMRNAHMMLDKYLLIGEEDFKDSIKSAVSLYCDYLIATYDNNREKVLEIINSLMDIPKNNLQSDWNTVMTESIKFFCGFDITNSDVKRLVSKFGQDFGIVSNCYMSSWIRNAFYDMSYFQATFLNLFMVVRGALNKKYSNKVQAVNNTAVGNNRFGAPVR